MNAHNTLNETRKTEGEKMKRKYIGFNADAEGYRMMAVFLAQLEKEGVTYSVSQDLVGFEVELTGGF